MSGDLVKLAERVEGLTGPCRETDAAIATALGWRVELPPRDSDRPLPNVWIAPDGSRHMAFPPNWTESPDAVVTHILRNLGPQTFLLVMQEALDKTGSLPTQEQFSRLLLARTLRALSASPSQVETQDEHTVEVRG